jgi:hypothetical protein
VARLFGLGCMALSCVAHRRVLARGRCALRSHVRASSRLAALGAGREAGSPRSVSRSIRGRSCGGEPCGSRRRRGTAERLAAHTARSARTQPARTIAGRASPALSDPASRPLPGVPRGEGSGRELRRCNVARMATSMAAPLPRQSSPGPRCLGPQCMGPRRRGQGGAALRARETRGAGGRAGAGGAMGRKIHASREGRMPQEETRPLP